MEDIDNYFRKWREWRNGDLGGKSSTSVKGAEKDEERRTNQSINQLNKSINSMSIYFNKS